MKSSWTSKKKKPSSPWPVSPRRIDFQQLPVKEIGGILRKLGTELIIRLLKGDSIPMLTSLLTDDDCLILSQSHTWKLNRFRRKGTPPVTLKDLITKLLDNGISTKQWRVGACNRVTEALGGAPGDGLPAVLWPVASDIAWHNPDFLYEIAWNVFQYLRNRELFSPYRMPGVEFSHETYWTLIALALPDRLTFLQRFSPRRRRTFKVQKLLREEARRRVMTAGWAGFWDQWLIKRTVEIWPSSFTRLDSGLFNSLTGLPILRGSTEVFIIRESMEPKTRLKRILRKWRQFIDKLKRDLGLLKSKLDEVLALGKPDWEKRKPGFLMRRHVK